MRIRQRVCVNFSSIKNTKITYLSLLFLFGFQLFAFAHFADLMRSGALARTTVLTVILSEAAGTLAAAFSFLFGRRLTACLRLGHRGLAGHHTLIIIRIHHWLIFGSVERLSTLSVARLSAWNRTCYPIGNEQDRERTEFAKSRGTIENHIKRIVLFFGAERNN